jgi:nitrate/nitrite transporter NarK
MGFIFIRIVLGHLPDRIGGFRVALWSLGVEALKRVLPANRGSAMGGFVAFL